MGGTGRQVMGWPASMSFEGFSVLQFDQTQAAPQLPAGGVVYLFCWLADGTEVPFYVGQTNRFSGRMRDYSMANYKACTDFRVGEALKYLATAKNFRIRVRYKASAAPRRDEKDIIRTLLISGVRLLNCLPAYDYRKDTEAAERETVQRFCDMLTARPWGANG